MDGVEKFCAAGEDSLRPLSREKREAILNGAALVFEEHGYAGASMSMIVAAAGVSKGTVYQHFPGKAALFGAAVARECSRSLAIAFESATPAAPLEDALRGIAERFITLTMSEKGIAIERIVQAEAERFPELAEAFWQAGPALVLAQLTGFINARQAAGELVVPDAGLAAEQFLALCQTRLVVRRRLGQPQTGDTIASIAAATARLFVAAYGRR